MLSLTNCEDHMAKDSYYSCDVGTGNETRSVHKLRSEYCPNGLNTDYLHYKVVRKFQKTKLEAQFCDNQAKNHYHKKLKYFWQALFKLLTN